MVAGGTERDAACRRRGYDHRAVAPGKHMHFFKTTSTAEYSVPISSIRYGGQELLNFAARRAGVLLFDVAEPEGEEL